MRRKALGFAKAEDFALAHGFKYPTIRDIEAGYSEGTPEMKRKLSAALGCTTADLYSQPSPKTESKILDNEQVQAIVGAVENLKDPRWEKIKKQVPEKALDILANGNFDKDRLLYILRNPPRPPGKVKKRVRK